MTFESDGIVTLYAKCDVIMSCLGVSTCGISLCTINVVEIRNQLCRNQNVSDSKLVNGSTLVYYVSGTAGRFQNDYGD